MSKIIAPYPQTWYSILSTLYDKPSIQLTFQITEDCCMACTYCYQNHKTNNKMDFETAKIAIDKILQLEKPENYSTIIFDFIGGEALMEVELLSQICEYILSQMIKLKHPWLLHTKFSICSNGLLYFNPKVQEFLTRFKHFVVLSFSIDGNQELHDACRVDKFNKGTYDRAINAVQHYRKNYRNLLNTKMTISPDNVKYTSEAIINLINLNYTEIFVNCIFEKGWNNNHATILYWELKKLADYLIEYNLYDKIFIRFFQEDLYQPQDETDNANWCGGVLSPENINFALDYKGDIYPCLRYMESSLNGRQMPLKLGNINNDKTNIVFSESENIKLLSNITRRSQSTDECFNCPISKGCAWCSGYNYEEFGTPNKRATYICCMHKATSLANVYFFNTLYRKLNLNTRFKLYLSKEEALKIIDDEEYKYLFNLSKE